MPNLPGRIATFTLAARDADTDTWAILTASNYLAVGALVPWIDCKAGLVVSQSFANPDAAGAALEAMRQGQTPTQALEVFLSGDTIARKRQVALMDLSGEATIYNGPECTDEVESVQGNDFLVLGNMLKAGTCEQVAETYSASRRAGYEMGDAMLKAMIAGQQAGGDKRGKLAAALLMKRPAAGYLGSSDTLVDLRVDAHPRPLLQLRDLYSLFKLYNPHQFDLHMVALDDLENHQLQLLFAILRQLNKNEVTVDINDTATIKNILAEHNLSANFDHDNQRVSQMLINEGHALMRLLTSPL
ncbi:MAG: DUF1028 domain-containing protein [Gammaproteobacteria bacterium]|nr:DUF1028 domain-containing protein [Gammaproteobacteria bacterium]